MKLTLLLPVLLILPLLRGDTPQAGTAQERAADISKYTNALTLSAPEGAGTVAQVAARALERAHFSRMRFRDELSSRLFERYLESLDPQRVYFLQSDYEQFAKYKTRLDDLTMIEKDVQPAYEIFNRFL
jgi:carboxyl-terminal processing protease